MIARIARITLTATLVGAVAGCVQYLDRRDTLLLGAGEAVETNIVAHQIDPWPAHASNVYATTNGERMQRAQERYRTSQGGGTGLAPNGAYSIGSPVGTTSTGTSIAPSIR